MAPQQPITVPRFTQLKSSGTPITVLTAYDYPTARLLDQAGIEAILVGDSLAMVVQGKENTLPVTLDQMIYHAEMVARAASHALVVVDMPFMSYHLGPTQGVENGGRILKETLAQSVKLEGGELQAPTIEAMTQAGIPVMAHCGLRPQNVHQLGSYKVQRDRDQLIADAQAACQAGAFAIVLECIPAELAAEITELLPIPTIGIGAGPHCDGQVLVINDLLGFDSGYVPRFVKAYANLEATISAAVTNFRDEVRGQQFPGEEHSY